MSISAVARSRLEQRIARLESELATARSIFSALDTHPEIVEMLMTGMVSEDSPREPRKKRARGGSQCDQIIEFFRSHDNAWMTRRQIVEGCKLDKGAVSAILYSSGRDRFESREHPDAPRMRQFRAK